MTPWYFSQRLIGTDKSFSCPPSGATSLGALSLRTCYLGALSCQRHCHFSTGLGSWRRLNWLSPPLCSHPIMSSSLMATVWGSQWIQSIVSPIRLMSNVGRAGFSSSTLWSCWVPEKHLVWFMYLLALGNIPVGLLLFTLIQNGDSEKQQKRWGSQSTLRVKGMSGCS